jgi:WD40 repeat protein
MNEETNNYHKVLAKYFANKPLYLDEPTQKKPNVRKLMELPWQQTKAAIIEKDNEELWDNITNTLCNLDFIQAKAVAKMTYDLVNDFNEVLEVIPDNQENILEEKARQARMDKYTKDLIACAKGEITVDELEITESITPWTEQQIDAEIDRIKTSPTKADHLKEFLNFLGNESNNLQNYSSEIAFFSHQQAWNYSNDGIMCKLAEKRIKEIGKSLLIRSQHSRPQWQPLPLKVKQIKGYENPMVDITPDGKLAIFSSGVQCIFWNLVTGKVLQVLNGHTKKILSVSLTPDGCKAISSSEDNTILIWDLKSGKIIHAFHNSIEYNTIVISPDGKMAVACGKEAIIKLDLESKITDIINVSGIFFTAIAITPDCKFAITGSYESTCIFWDLYNGKQIKTLEGHTDKVSAVNISPDGKQAISGSYDKTCILWDLTTLKPKKVIETKEHITAISFTADGKWAVSGHSDLSIMSGNHDTTIILWNLKSGRIEKIINGHTDGIKSVVITPNGRWAISGSNDDLCILWDLTFGQFNNFINLHSDYVLHVDSLINGKSAFSGSWDRTCAIWNLESAKPVKHLIKHKGKVVGLKITPDNNRLISVGSQEGCIIWDANTGSVIDQKSDEPYWDFCGCVTPNGELALSASKNVYTIWKIYSGQIVNRFNLPTSKKDIVVITPDGKRVLSTTNDNSCILWSLSSGEITNIFSDHKDIISAMAISPDGKMFVTGSYDTRIILYSLHDGKILRIFSAAKSIIRALIFTPDAEKIIASYDSSCVLWDIKTDKKIAQFLANSTIMDISYFAGGVFGGESSGDVFILKLNKGLLNKDSVVVTVKCIWDFNRIEFIMPIADCPFCGRRFEPSQTIIQLIIQILNESGITSKQSPCLVLPDEAWENPGLFGECPNCNEKLKFNPFFGSDLEEIKKYYEFKEKDSQFQKILEDAEKSFNEKNWETAYNSYLKLVQQGKFDVNELRFKMALCIINSLQNNDPDIIQNINVLIRLLQEKGEYEKVLIIEEKLKERLDTFIKKPWWKKMF